MSMKKSDIDWIDAEISFIHVFLYWILGILTGGYWWILFGFLIVMSFRHAVVRVIRLVRSGNANEYKL